MEWYNDFEFITFIIKCRKIEEFLVDNKTNTFNY